MKKKYVKPSIVGEKFIANEYIAACWNISCNVPRGYGYFEKNDREGYQENGDELIASGKGCGTTHVASGIDAAGPSENAMWQETYLNGGKKGDPYSVFYFQARNTEAYYGSNHHFCTLDAVNWEENPNASN